MEKLNWIKLKILLDTVSPPLYSFKEDDQYINIFIVLHGILFDCDINKESSDYTEFQTSYRSKLNLKTWDLNGRLINNTPPFSDASGFRFRGASFIGTCAAMSTENIDYKIEQERYINGGTLIIDNIGNNDKMTFQVIDKDNVLGFGTNVVLDQFITDYYIPNNKLLEVRLDYPARISAGLYVRMIYTNTSLETSTIKCNLYLHWKSV